MRIAIIGFGAESSTFTLHRMDTDSFDEKRGDDLLAFYALDEWFAGRDDLEWFPLLRAHGGAGGPIVPAVFDGIVAELEQGLAALVADAPLDGVLVDLHGASHVDGRDHAEEELMGRVRAVVGDDCVISLSMDTHGNFSRELAELVDLAVCFRHAPHVDAPLIRERAARNLVAVVETGAKPVKAYVRVPLLLPGERTSTIVEPAKSAFGGIEPAIARHGVIDASLWVGFYWGDEDRNGGAVLVTGWDEAAVRACAEEVAHLYWDPREGFVIVAERSGEWDGALDLALERPAAPYFVSDSGDNVTAGGSGDVTFSLTRTLERTDVVDAGLRMLFASLTDGASVDAAVEVGVGGVLDRAIGAVLDDRYAAPVRRAWQVVRTFDGVLPGEGVVGALLRHGAIDVIVKRSRTAFYDPAVSARRHGRKLPGHVWLDVDGYDAIVVKNGYLFPDQAALAATWYMAITPGGTDLDAARLAWSRVDRPVYPLDTDFTPDLTPVVLPARGAR